MKKRMLLFTILFNVLAILLAANPTQYLIKIDRNLLLTSSQQQDQYQLLQKLSTKVSVLYAGKNYLLARADEKALAEIPHASYNLLDSYPLTDNWFLLSVRKGADTNISAETGTLITRIDQTILLKTPLSETELSKVTAMPFVRLSETPIRLQQQSAINTPPTTRTDFGDLLNQVSADSIAWFMQHLQDFGTRYAHASNRLTVANWIKDQFLRFGITNAHTEQFTAQDYDQYNVVATIPGTLAPTKYIVIGGHHDSIVLDGNDPLFTAPGADDNASGAAAVLEMARIMKANNYQPECTIKFITFACEEFGLFGSFYDAQVAANTGLDIKLMINHDMISTSTQSPDSWNVNLNIYEGAFDYAILASNVTAAQTSLNPLYWYYNTSGSDSYSYFMNGFPAIYFDEHDFSPNYHSITDLVSNTNPQFVKEVIMASTATAVTVDQMPSPVKSTYIVDTGTGNSLQANWNNLDLESDVVSYKVYVQLQSEPAPTEYVSSGMSFIVPNLVADSTYYIGVSAIDNDGNEGIVIYVTGVPHSIPQIPTGLIDQPIMHAVVLNWNANHELDIAGYRIYRSTSIEGPYSAVNQVPLANLTYTDTGIQDLLYYYYKLVAVDTDNHESPATAIIRSRALTLNQGVLIVDETRNNTGNSVFAPNDLVSDQFFDNVLHDFQHAQYDTETADTLKLADLGIYSSIFWHGNEFGNLTYPYAVRDEIKKYMQLGGNIMISSYLPTQAFDNNDNYPNTFAAGDFLYDNFGIESTNYSNLARFKYALPQDSGFPALTVDTLKTLAPLHGHIYTIESIGANANAENIYFYGSDYLNTTSQGLLNGLPVGVYSQNGPGKTVVLSFPLYNMYASQVINLMDYVFGDLFGETVANQDNTELPIMGLNISRIYPNPFSGSIHLEVQSAKSTQPLTVSVYNIKGQRVKTLFNGIAKDKIPGLNWDGKDESGKKVSSSMYFIRAEQGGKAVSRKVIKLN